MRLYNQRNEVVFFAYDDQCKKTYEELNRNPGNYISTCKIPKDFLNDGNYKVLITIDDSFVTYFKADFLLSFDVEDSKDVNGSRGMWVLSNNGLWPPSVVRPKLKWDVKYSPFQD